MNFDEAAEQIRRRAEEANNASVRIAFLGQPGAGKSSLINALVGEEIARVSEITDETIEAESYQWHGLVLCDLPGYGTRLFPAKTYFEEFDIPTFDIILCISAGKFSANDTEFYRRLQTLGKTCIFVRNKSDTLFHKGLTKDQLKDQIQ
jgi:small GTP-binding protein